MTTRPAGRHRGHRTARPLIIVVTNGKGGTGKSTVVLGLAAMAAALHVKTLIVDADAQRTAWHISEVMRRNGELGYEFTSETDLRALAKIQDLQGFHLILIDTPGSLASPILPAVLAQCDVALVPTDFTVVSIEPTMETVRFVEGHRKRAVALLNSVQDRYGVEAVARSLLSAHNVPCLTGRIRRYAIWQNAMRDMTPISTALGEYAARARADAHGVLMEILAWSPELLALAGAGDQPMAAG